ncbi:hypothetical protein PTKIN_Ptkin11bG0013000 [Pterospermum kingtungense]
MIEADKSFAACNLLIEDKIFFLSFFFSWRKLLFRIGEMGVGLSLTDKLGNKVRVECNEDDTIGDLKKLVAALIRTRAYKIRIQKWYTILKDHITLKNYGIRDGTPLKFDHN